MNNDPAHQQGLLFRQDQGIPVGETDQEPVGTHDLLALDAPGVLDVPQVLRCLDVADAPAEESDCVLR